MAGQRPEWTYLLFPRGHGGQFSGELPPNDQTLDFVSTLTDPAEFGVSPAAHFVRGVLA